MTMMRIDPQSFEALVLQYQTRVNQTLDHWLPPESVHPIELHKAMRYSVLAPGKRVRPILVYATASALDLDLSLVDGIAAALEIIHAYSLIHDDLPAMDDDDLRRGRPTCHCAFDEATVITTLAFQRHFRPEAMNGLGDLHCQELLRLYVNFRG